jgi:hypothetical protein
VVTQGRRSSLQHGHGSKSVFSRLNFSSVADHNLSSNQLPCSSLARFNHGGSFLPRNSDRAFISNLNSAGSVGPTRLSGANAVPLGNRPSKPNRRNFSSRPSCSRCLSNFHSRPNCRSSTRCTACFRLGHVAFSCCFPPRFPGLSKTGIFSTQTRPEAWDPLITAT